MVQEYGPPFFLKAVRCRVAGATTQRGLADQHSGFIAVSVASAARIVSMCVQTVRLLSKKKNCIGWKLNVISV